MSFGNVLNTSPSLVGHGLNLFIYLFYILRQILIVTTCKSLLSSVLIYLMFYLLFLDSFTADHIVYKWKKENKTWSPNLEIAQFTLDSVTVQQKGKTYVTGTCDNRQGFF